MHYCYFILLLSELTVLILHEESKAGPCPKEDIVNGILKSQFQYNKLRSCISV